MARMEQDNEKPASRKVIQPEQPKQEWQFNTGWILATIALLGMAYILRNVRSSVTWNDVLDFLGVSNCAAYTRLFHLFLIITFIVAAVKIIGRKDDR